MIVSSDKTVLKDKQHQEQHDDRLFQGPFLQNRPITNHFFLTQCLSKAGKITPIGQWAFTYEISGGTCRTERTVA